MTITTPTRDELLAVAEVSEHISNAFVRAARHGLSMRHMYAALHLVTETQTSAEIALVAGMDEDTAIAVVDPLQEALTVAVDTYGWEPEHVIDAFDAFVENSSTPAELHGFYLRAWYDPERADYARH